MMPQQKPGRSKQDYGTPRELLDRIEQQMIGIPFEWDLAASPENAIAPNFYTEVDNSLIQNWDVCAGWLWCNPPYGNIAPWVKKAAESKDSRIVILVPASVGANWWRDYVDGQCEVLFLNGRLTFVGHTQPFPKDCAVLIYDRPRRSNYKVWNWRKEE